MKVLVIPDIHLKPWIFDRAEKILKDGKADRAVCLMDIPDDWNMEFQIERQRKPLSHKSHKIRAFYRAIFGDIIPFYLPRHSSFTIMQGFAKWGRVGQNMAGTRINTTV